MERRYEAPMTNAEIAATPDEQIDTSDIPELGDAFWASARLIERDRTKVVTLRVKQSVLDAFKAGGQGYQTRMNAVLEAYARTLPGRGGADRGG